MSSQAISTDSCSTTSSAASQDGHLLWKLPGGVQTSLFLLEVHHASHSRRQAAERESQIKGICGPNGSASSASVALTQSLLRMLRPQLDMAGSTLFRQTWKRKTTPLGRLYMAHIASALRTSDKDFIGSLPTPVASEVRDCAKPEVLAKCDRGGRIGRWICARSSAAHTHKGVVTVNPSFVRELMGYPPEWCVYAPMEMP